jgi:GTP-binding protein HflX
MEKVLLVKLYNRETDKELKGDLEEMEGLIQTAGGTVVDTVLQKRAVISPAFYIGKGKAGEIAVNYKDKVDLVVIDADLKPGQLRNLEDTINKRVIDRTQLILDIFAQRAFTAEGKLQVEYAQLNYMLPRLTNRDAGLMQQTGGIGTRGPGETKIEVDRRKIRQRLQKIKKDLESVKEIREQQRYRRKTIPMPLIAIVGYTNAGKTMFLNTMTGAGMLSEDRLFATLDSKIKRYTLPVGYKILFSDTVGFIKKLPTQLIAAFRSTLEEVREADIILHIIDFYEEGWEQRRETVIGILKEIGAFENKKIIEVFNKIDLIHDEYRKMIISRKEGFYISAKTGEGIDRLVRGLEEAVSRDFEEHEILITPAHAGLAGIFYEDSLVLKREDREDGVFLRVRCLKKTMEKYLQSVKEEK